MAVRGAKCQGVAGLMVLLVVGALSSACQTLDKPGDATTEVSASPTVSPTPEVVRFVAPPSAKPSAAAVKVAPAVKPKPVVQQPKPAAPVAKTDPDYGTCKEAKANGAGPYYRGQDPEYDWYRDADGDGIVCE